MEKFSLFIHFLCWQCRTQKDTFSRNIPVLFHIRHSFSTVNLHISVRYGIPRHANASENVLFTILFPHKTLKKTPTDITKGSLPMLLARCLQISQILYQICRLSFEYTGIFDCLFYSEQSCL